MKASLLLLLIFRYVSSAENHMWSLCSSSSQWSQWIYKNPGNQVENWLKSVTDREDKCPYTPITMSEYNFVSDNMTLVDAINDTLTGFGWKIAAHYSNEHPWHAGYFYGKMDSKGYINGDQVVYLYPDFETVMVGNFQNEVMISAQEAKLKAFKCKNGIMRIKVSNPKKDAPTFNYCPKSKIRINDQPLLVDPQDRKNAFVKTGPFGDSMFARRYFKAGDIILYYSGIIFDNAEINWANKTTDEKWDFHKNMIKLDGGRQLNVPKEFWPIWKYRATLGHKINHSFTHSNSKFGFGHHPRFGFIRTVVATKDIRAGEELWVNYGYNVKNPNVPQWYRDTYIREVGPIKYK